MISGIDQNIEVVKELATKDDIMLSDIENNKRDILQSATIYIQCQFDNMGNCLVRSAVISLNSNLFKKTDSVQFEVFNKRNHKVGINNCKSISFRVR
jgi:hypothetical protein